MSNKKEKKISDSLVMVGYNIRKYRKIKGLTIEKLGELSDLSAPYLSKVENGRINISIESLDSISQVLEVPIAALVINSLKE